MEPPWGNCTEEKPKYYDKFTVSACQMDCENDLARNMCKCLNVNMPKLDSGEVDSYCFQSFSPPIRAEAPLATHSFLFRG